MISEDIVKEAWMEIQYKLQIGSSVLVHHQILVET